MRNTKKAFTLVELIVVITILAILWTIAFISLSGYSADARNGKRTQDLNSLNSAISTKTTEWVSLLALVNGTGSALTNASIAWTSAVAWTDYKAWDVNYATLWIKSEDFSDPDWVAYVMWATSRVNGKFELSASMENGSWEKTAKVQWNYIPRTVSAVGVTLSSWNKMAITDENDINKFQKWDTLSWSVTVLSISSDLQTLTLSDDTLSGSTNLYLGAAESVSLIWAKDDLTTVVTDWWADLAY